MNKYNIPEYNKVSDSGQNLKDENLIYTASHLLSKSQATTCNRNNNENINAFEASPKLKLPSDSELSGQRSDQSTSKEDSILKSERRFPFHSTAFKDVGSDEELEETSDHNFQYRKQKAHEKGKFQSKQFCWFYSDHGYCRYGRNCKYIHRKKKKFYQSPKKNAEYDDRAFTNVENNTEVLDLAGKFQSTDLSNKVEICDPLLVFDTSSSGIAHGAKTSEQFNYEECTLPFKQNESFSSNSPQHTSHQEVQKTNEFSPNTSQTKEKITRNSKQRTKFMKKYPTVACSNTNLNVDVPKRICFYYKEGFCHKGDKCKFWHAADFRSQTIEDLKNIVQSETEIVKEEINVEKKPAVITYKDDKLKLTGTRTIPNTRQALLLEHLNESNLCSLRETEIEQLKKRFPKYEAFHSDFKDIFECLFSSSDPDWPFDVKAVRLQVTFSTGYPQEVCEIQIMNKEETLPPLLLRYLNKCIQEWLTERHQANVSVGKVELIFRPFLLWLDRNLQDLFTRGLRKVKQDLEARTAGIEFVPYEDLPGGQLEHQNLALSQQHIAEEENHMENNCGTQKLLEESEITEENNKIVLSGKENCEPSVSAIHKDKELEKINIACTNADQFLKHNIPKRGTEIKLQELELKENVGALTCQKIYVIVKCSRCKTHHEISSPARRNNVINCTKCHNDMQVTLQPAMLHQYSAVLGYLHFLGCQAIDIPLMKCDFSIDCLNCSNQMTVNGIHYGQQFATWCLFCNKKLVVCVQSIKFQQLQPAQIIGTGHRIVLEKKARKVKDHAIQEGMPLPNTGSCKHYKKSYRWLRFPCCGKVYPCDVCHNEKETDHEMKFANHMVCGFCAKEQPYSTDRPCINCASNMIKKSGIHWEGGKGCRDKIKMSREDRQKYSGMSKTSSRKSQDRKPKKK